MHICIARIERKSGAASPSPLWSVFSSCLRSGPAHASVPVPGDPLHINDYGSRTELREPPQADWKESRALVSAQGIRLLEPPG